MKLCKRITNKFNDSQNNARNQNNIVLAALFRGLLWEGDGKREIVSRRFGDQLVKPKKKFFVFTLSGLDNTYSQSLE